MNTVKLLNIYSYRSKSIAKLDTILYFEVYFLFFCKVDVNLVWEAGGAPKTLRDVGC